MASGLDATADNQKPEREVSFAYVLSTEAEWFLQYKYTRIHIKHFFVKAAAPLHFCV